MKTAQKRDRYWDQKRSDRRPENPVSYHSRGASSEDRLLLAMHCLVDEIQEAEMGAKCLTYGIDSKSAYTVLVETSAGEALGRLTILTSHSAVYHSFSFVILPPGAFTVPKSVLSCAEGGGGKFLRHVLGCVASQPERQYSV